MRRGSQPRARSPSVAPRRPGFTPGCTQCQELITPAGRGAEDERGGGGRAGRPRRAELLGLSPRRGRAGSARGRGSGSRPKRTLSRSPAPAPTRAPQAGLEEEPRNNERPAGWAGQGGRPRHRPRLADHLLSAPRSVRPLRGAFSPPAEWVLPEPRASQTRAGGRVAHGRAARGWGCREQGSNRQGQP